MLMKQKFILHSILFILLISTNLYSLPGSGTIKGTVSDAQTKEPLPFASIYIKALSKGAGTDAEGRFTLANIPSGTYVIRATYIGYKQLELSVKVTEGKTTECHMALTAESFEGETVVVTAQAEGQMAAINEQLSSISVKNVVSSARIQELPDANAAESVGRLPGVSLLRTGGEGSQVVIRGLSPQYNQVTIDGVELPSDVASNNNITSGDKNQQSSAGLLGDRAADLSMISSSMLGGIEVIKAITPDMDATLIGGVVNFDMRKAAKNLPNRSISAPWLPMIDITSQGGYNNLKNEYKDYKFVASLEKRFFDDSFGVFLQGTVEQRNLSDNELGADYFLNDKTHGDAGRPDLISLDLTDVYRTRKRNGLTAVLDYQHKTGEIGFMNFFSSSDTRAISRGESIVQTSNDLWYSANDAHNKLNVISNLLSIKQDIPLFHVDFKLSHSYTESRNPEDLYFDFWQEDAGLGNKGDLSKVPPSTLAAYVTPNYNAAGLMNIRTSEIFQRERVITGNLDFETELTFTELLNAKIKFGGMYQHRNRWYDYNEYSGNQGYSGGGNVVSAFQKAYPWLQFAGGRLGLVNFIDSTYSYGEFLNGDYKLAYPIGVDLMWKLLPIAKRTSSLEGYQINKLASALNDYNGDENKSAGYAMVTFNIGDMITVLPGVRYQNLTTTFTAMRGETVPGGIQGHDTTVTQSHGYFLPMVHLRYKPTNWLQVHFAYTNTLNYPDYSTITPRYYVGTGFVSYNNYRLNPARSENYDLVISVFTNEIGLFTIDGFKKKIRDLIFYSHTYVTNFDNYPDLPKKKNQLYDFNTYINNPMPIDIYGLETEWQTRFWFLPQPFSGLLLTANYTHIFSEANYPRSIVNTSYNEDGTFKQTIVDTFYTTRMLNQPNDIVNLSIGYDYGGFSARLSMLYQDNIFKRPDFWMQNRVNSAKYTRWDLSVRQELPWYGIQVFFNMNNITGENDIDINQKNSFPASEQRYGMTSDLGLRLKL